MHTLQVLTKLKKDMLWQVHACRIVWQWTLVGHSEADWQCRNSKTHKNAQIAGSLQQPLHQSARSFDGTNSYPAKMTSRPLQPRNYMVSCSCMLPATHIRHMIDLSTSPTHNSSTLNSSPVTDRGPRHCTCSGTSPQALVHISLICKVVKPDGLQGVQAGCHHLQQQNITSLMKHE